MNIKKHLPFVGRFGEALRFVGVFLTLLLTSCDTNFTYSTYPCYLVIENSIHMDATLASAMNAMSPGVFCQITNDDVKKTFSFKNNYGQTSTIHYNEKDSYRTRALGMNGALIVGFGTLTNEFYAYDRECPNCYDPEAIGQRSRPLTVSEGGVATCGVCSRQYNMNTGGNFCGTKDDVTIAGESLGMTRYRCSTTGPYGILSIGN